MNLAQRLLSMALLQLAKVAALLFFFGAIIASFFERAKK